MEPGEWGAAVRAILANVADVDVLPARAAPVPPPLPSRPVPDETKSDMADENGDIDSDEGAGSTTPLWTPGSFP